VSPWFKKAVLKKGYLAGFRKKKKRINYSNEFKK